MTYEIKRLSDYSEESLLNELRRIAKVLNKNTVTMKELKQYGKADAKSSGINLARGIKR